MLPLHEMLCTKRILSITLTEVPFQSYKKNLMERKNKIRLNHSVPETNLVAFEKKKMGNRFSFFTKH